MTDFKGLLKALTDGNVEFIVVGGAAATAHGSSRLTLDLDVVYRRSRENIARVFSALKDHDPYPRGAPTGLPFRWGEKTVASGLNFTLTTDLGDLDLLGEIPGGGTYEALVRDAVVLDLFGMKVQIVGLERLIQVKRASGRPKDFEVIAELEAIREEQETET